MFFRGGVNYIRKIENFYLLKTFFEETKNVLSYQIWNLLMCDE